MYLKPKNPYISLRITKTISYYDRLCWFIKYVI